MSKRPISEIGGPSGASPARESGGVLRTNAQRRPREHLLPAEVAALIRAARRTGRYGARDAALLLLAYRHGLRVSELCNLEWSDVDLRAGTLAVRRLKSGAPSTHPLRAVELRAVRLLRRSATGPHVFTTERGSSIHPRTVRDIVARAGRLAQLPFPVHPHMLRHACGYALANRGHDTRAIAGYLGHRNLQSTMRYTELAPNRFRDFWRDGD